MSETKPDNNLSTEHPGQYDLKSLNPAQGATVDEALRLLNLYLRDMTGDEEASKRWPLPEPIEEGSVKLEKMGLKPKRKPAKKG